MRALDVWRMQVLSVQARSRLAELIQAQRYEPNNADLIDALMDAFLGTLNEGQLAAFSRLLTEMTEKVH